MRTFAKEALAYVADDERTDQEARPAVFDLDLAGGFVHPAFIASSGWHVLVSSGYGEPLSDSDFSFGDDQALIYSVGCYPTKEWAYDLGFWHDKQIACHGGELVEAIREMVTQCEGFEKARIRELAKACEYECGGEMGLDQLPVSGSTTAVDVLVEWMEANRDLWTDEGDSACNWLLTDEGHGAWATYLCDAHGIVPNGTAFEKGTLYRAEVNLLGRDGLYGQTVFTADNAESAQAFGRFFYQDWHGSTLRVGLLTIPHIPDGYRAGQNLDGPMSAFTNYTEEVIR